MQKTFEQEVYLVLIDKLIIGLLIVVAGYCFNKLLEKFKGEQALRKEVETLRDQTALRYLQSQIEELYSPLLGLIQHSRIVYEIAQQKLPRLKVGIPHGEATRDEAEIWRYFIEKHFLPLNTQMADLIQKKIYLINSDEVPESFQKFLVHQAQYDCLHSLWKEKQIASDEIVGVGWPKDFEEKVKSSLTDLRKDYNTYAKRLKNTA